VGAALLLLGALAGCAAHPQPPAPVLPALAWHEVSLPVAGTGRPQVAALSTCPGHWYAAGAYRTPDGATTPALWTSDDGSAWRAVPAHPVSAYGPSHLLSALACRGDTVVAVGSAAGGAHGNLRTNTWIRSGDGPLTEIPAPFELYGGDAAIGVGRLTAGPAGWLLGGARRDADGQPGAAVWNSVDGRTFRLIDADPALESGTGGQTTATDETAGPTGFTLVGSVLPPGSKGLARDPLVCVSTDGLHWQRLATPATADDEELQRVTPTDTGLLALGVRATGFAAWRTDSTIPTNPASSGGPVAWRQVGRFGAFHGSDLPGVIDLTVVGGTAYTLISDGEHYQLWTSRNVSRDGASWAPLPLPDPLTAANGHRVALVSAGHRLLLATDDATATHLWTADL
jgi:hypothetical protein